MVFIDSSIHCFKGSDERYLLHIPSGAKLSSDILCLRQQLIEEAQHVLIPDHLGIVKTLHRLYEQFYWHIIHLDVVDYCRSCVQRHRNIPANSKTLGLLQRLQIVWRPWSAISTDFISRLPASGEGRDTIFAVIDQMTKHAHLIHSFSDALAAQTAHQIFNHVRNNHELPIKIISDRDVKFASRFWNVM